MSGPQYNPGESRSMGFMTLQKNRISPMEDGKSLSRKTSMKQVWEENYEKKTRELKNEQRKISQQSGKNSDGDLSDVTTQQCLKSTFGVKRFLNIFSSKRFRDKTLENLYIRYFLKVDQSSQSIIQVLSIVICILLIVFFYVSGLDSPVRAVVLGIIVLVFVTLEVLLYQIRLDFISLQIICYMSLFLLLGVVCTITLDTQPHDVADGMWVTLFFVYMAYTGVPVRMTAAVITGILLPVFQVALTTNFNVHQVYTQRQVRPVVSVCLF